MHAAAGGPTAAAVRAAYPNPMSSEVVPDDPDDPLALGCYCVGGALLMSLGKSCTSLTRFPSPRLLEEALERLNPSLCQDVLCDRFTALAALPPDWTVRLSHGFAVAIIDANDRGDFEAAWRALDQALRFGGDEKGHE
jgi:hypothetical protein